MADRAYSMSRRALLSGLTVTPLLAASPALPSPATLGNACIEQVQRLAWWDANSGALTDEEEEIEMDRWGAVSQRAILEPSAGPVDVAGKAHLLLADLDRFYPEEQYAQDTFRLMRVILREVVAMGGRA